MFFSLWKKAHCSGYSSNVSLIIIIRRGYGDTKVTQESEITQMLVIWRAGDSQALNQLMPAVHENLRQLANKYMRSERAGHALQATALINEAFLKLCDSSVSWQDRAHFIAIAARAMRQMLVDHARSKHRQKRGGDDVRVTLYDARIADAYSELDVLDIEDAMGLEKMDQRNAQIFVYAGRISLT